MPALRIMELYEGDDVAADAAGRFLYVMQRAVIRSFGGESRWLAALPSRSDYGGRVSDSGVSCPAVP